MKALTELQSDALEWRASQTPGTFELVSGTDLFATLAWADPDTLARVETAEGHWTLKRVGVFTRHVTIREEGSHTDIAEFRPHAFGRGRLIFKDGAEFRWSYLPHDEGRAFFDASDRMMVRLQTLPHPVGHEPEPGQLLGRVTLAASPGARSREALLAALEWTIHLLAVHDAALDEDALVGTGLP